MWEKSYSLQQQQSRKPPRNKLSRKYATTSRKRFRTSEGAQGWRLLEENRTLTLSCSERWLFRVRHSRESTPAWALRSAFTWAFWDFTRQDLLLLLLHLAQTEWALVILRLSLQRWETLLFDNSLQHSGLFWRLSYYCRVTQSWYFCFTICKNNKYVISPGINLTENN